MKKLFFSLMTLSLLFTSCSNDDNVTPTTDNKMGTIQGVLKFEGVGQNVRSAMSTAIPITSWDNIKQAQMFLYDAATGNIAYSYTFNPSATKDKFTWTNIPEGTYDLAIVANTKSSTDNITTFLGGTTSATEWTDFNVRGRKLNTQIFADLKPASAFPSAYNAKKGVNDRPFIAPSEIFTAYTQGVQIQQGVTTDLSGTPLALKREVALMRVRIDKTDSRLARLNFADASASILIHNQPVGFGFKLGDFAGGIQATPSDKDRILVGAQGTNAFNTTNPTTATHNPTTILDSKFTLWKDIMVLPNATKADGKAADAKADNARKYFIMVSALAPSGFTLDDGTVLTSATPVFWWGTINEVFTPNNIREVNLTIKSSGSVTPPVDPTQEGGLIIKVSAPENWAANIQDSNLEV